MKEIKGWDIIPVETIMKTQETYPMISRILANPFPIIHKLLDKETPESVYNTKTLLMATT